jgi:hypothetical protein
MSVITVMLCGVGGQGTILAADLLAKVAASSVGGQAPRCTDVAAGERDTVVKFGEEVHRHRSRMVDHPRRVRVMRRRGVSTTEARGRLLVNPAVIQPLVCSR